MNTNRQTWLHGDTHFDHMNMCEYCGRPENFNELIIYHWKKMIAPDDLVYHIGDVYFGRRSKFFDCIKDLPGVKVLIKGNHDREKDQWYLNHGFVAVMELAVVKVRTKISNHEVLGWRVLLSHTPVRCKVEVQKHGGETVVMPLYNIHGHFHNNTLDKCEEYLTGILTKQHYLFSLEETNYKPILLDRAIEDRLVIQGR